MADCVVRNGWGGLAAGRAGHPFGAPSAAARRRRQAGVIGLTDVVLGIAVAAIALPAVIAMVNQQARETQDQIAAQQLKAIGEGAAAFVKDHFRDLYTSQIASQANIYGLGGSDVISVATLAAHGYLPQSFNDTNAYKQKQVLLLRRLAQDGGACAALPAPPPTTPTDCKQLIEAVVLAVPGTSPATGAVLDRGHAGHIAVLAGAHAGTIADKGTARGAYGTWCVDLKSFGGAVVSACPAQTPTQTSTANAANLPGTPDQGGLALALFFNGSEIMSEYLNRFFTGSAEDNTMHAGLDMGGNAITDATTVQIAGVTLEAQRMAMIDSLYGGTYTAHGGNLAATSYAATGTVAAGGDVTAGGNMMAGGNMTAAAFFHPSDATLKTDIRPIGEPLQLVERLQGHRFAWKDSGAPDLGFIAQEVQRVVPEAVGQGPNGKLAVKYDILSAALVEAVKVLAHRVETLETEQRAADPSAAPN